MTVAEQSIHDAIASAESLGWLAAYLQGVVDTGFPVPDLIALLEQVRVHLQESGNETAEDLVLDGLDLLAGWCGPGRQIVPSRAR